ncbi:LysR family transcriptional regulator [Pseudomonas oryzihabitans]|uniref:LysR family transcriptional regulator n=1 Tax=Pseudomonas oryzihabitans TaxID=47885 RepID=UPI002894F156|nr:LysR family transcriptional regulator [Pseudomonas oryzihabitans]MDT3722829.1 LysR family transcriptional regulator [Pseudomonas oryzihabitans]
MSRSRLSWPPAVEHGSFTAAGQALGRDGSILSRRVTALEKRLGVRLMERTTRRLALTEAGEAFHQRMRGALQALQEIEQDTAAAATGVRGTLCIALPVTFGRMWVAPILPAFLAAYPDLVVETAFEDRYVDLVAESFDVAVRIGTLTDSSLVARSPVSMRCTRKARPQAIRRECLCQFIRGSWKAVLVALPEFRVRPG